MKKVAIANVITLKDSPKLSSAGAIRLMNKVRSATKSIHYTQ